VSMFLPFVCSFSMVTGLRVAFVIAIAMALQIGQPIAACMCGSVSVSLHVSV